MDIFSNGETCPPLRESAPEEGCFLLRASGDSMAAAGIRDGNWVVIREQETAEEGEIVAVMADGELGLRIFAQGDGGVIGTIVARLSATPEG